MVALLNGITARKTAANLSSPVLDEILVGIVRYDTMMIKK